MNLHFSYKAESAKTPDAEREIQANVEKLGRYLSAFRPDLVHLHGTIDQKVREGFTISLNLRLPTGQLATQERGQVLLGALKVAFNDLISQLKRHKELIRHDYDWRRKRRPTRGAVTELQETVEQYVATKADHAGPQPRHGRESVKPERLQGIDIPPDAFEEGNLFKSDVRQFINGNLSKLQRFVERELAFREENGAVEPGQLTAEEVLDEVVVNALSSDHAPEGLPASRWIYRIALDSIDHLAHNGEEGSQIPLEETVGQPNVSGTDEDFLQYRQPGERHTREDFLPNDQVRTPEDAAANEEMITQLNDALRGLPKDVRNAFALFTIEGFTLDEVTKVMERDPAEVKRLISSAREHVMKKLPPSNALKQKLIQHSSVA